MYTSTNIYNIVKLNFINKIPINTILDLLFFHIIHKIYDIEVLTSKVFFDIIIKLDAKKRVCWNWQTGTFEGRVLRRTGSSPVTRTTSSENAYWKDG